MEGKTVGQTSVKTQQEVEQIKNIKQEKLRLKTENKIVKK